MIAYFPHIANHEEECYNEANLLWGSDTMITLFLLAILGGELLIGTMAVLLAFGWYLLLAVGRWRVFNKMGEPGWKGFIPVYADYILYGRCWQTLFFWISLAAGVVYAVGGGDQENAGALASVAGTLGSVLDAMLCWKLSRSFGHGVLVTLGLILFNPFFMLYLGMNSDAYLGPQ